MSPNKLFLSDFVTCINFHDLCVTLAKIAPHCGFYNAELTFSSSAEYFRECYSSGGHLSHSSRSHHFVSNNFRAIHPLERSLAGFIFPGTWFHCCKFAALECRWITLDLPFTNIILNSPCSCVDAQIATSWAQLIAASPGIT